jgi:hypothetical protein
LAFPDDRTTGATVDDARIHYRHDCPRWLPERGQ